MTNEWKPPTATQVILGQMVIQGWKKEKILNWWKKELCPPHNCDLEKLLQWIDKNVEE